MRRWRRLTPKAVVFLQKTNRPLIVRKPNIAQQMRRKTIERRDSFPLVAIRQPSAYAAEPAGAGRLTSGKPADFKSLSHDPPICFQRPRLAYVSVTNLRSTF
jgi:hypothetical protein